TFKGNNWSPIWAPDGNQLVFSSSSAIARLPTKLYQKAASGVGVEKLLFEGDPAGEAIFPEAWSPDGRYIVFARVKIPAVSIADLWILPLGATKSRLRTSRPDSGTGTRRFHRTDDGLRSRPMSPAPIKSSFNPFPIPAEENGRSRPKAECN